MQLEQLLDSKTGIPMGDGILYHMTINEELILHARSFLDDRYFYLYGSLGHIPPLERLGSLMEASLFNHGLYFCCHKASNKLLLMVALDSHVATFEHFDHSLQTLVNTLTHWKREIQSFSQSFEKEEVLKIMSQKKRVFFI